jgi:hypothetical protein
MEEKTLGQIAWEAYHEDPLRRPWLYRQSSNQRDWERVAQAVLAAASRRRSRPKKTRKSRSKFTSVFSCNHANENPHVCPCQKNCYCKKPGNTCGPRK